MAQKAYVMRRVQLGPTPPGGFAAYMAAFVKAKQTFRHQRVFDPDSGKVVPLTPSPPGAPPSSCS